MNRFRDALERGTFVVTGEVSPPRGCSLAKMEASVATLAPWCDAINVTDNQGASLHLSSLAASKIVKDCGVEPVFQQTCRDRNRLALQSDLLAAWTLGLENVLAVTGDSIDDGDHPQARGVYDLDSSQLIALTRQLNEGFASNGAPLDGIPNFYVGAAVFPEAEPWEFARGRAQQKVDAGAQFFQTQAVMEIDTFASRILELKALGIKVIAGILLLKSRGVIDFINNHLAGMMVPEHISHRILSAADPYEEAIALAIEQASVIAEVADGIHVMPLGDNEAAVRILKEAGITPAFIKDPSREGQGR